MALVGDDRFDGNHNGRLPTERSAIGDGRHANMGRRHLSVGAILATLKRSQPILYVSAMMWPGAD